MNGQSATDFLKETTGMSIGWAIVMLALGVLAILMPFTTGIGVSIFVGWIIVFSGFAYLAYAFAAHGAARVAVDSLRRARDPRSGIPDVASLAFEFVVGHRRNPARH